MTSIKASLSSLALAGALFLAPTVQAIPFNITMSLPHNGSSILVNDVSKGDVGDIFGSGNGDWFDFLVSDVTTYNNNIPASLPGPVAANANGDPFFTAEGSPPSMVNVTGYTYALLHYGKGSGGEGKGGGLQVWYLDGLDGTWDFSGNTLGPNGNGGLSFVRLYKGGTSVPDGGSTLLLLGSILLVFFGVRSRFTLKAR